MRGYLRDLLEATSYRYFLFWDGAPRGIGRLKTIKGKPHSIEIHALENIRDQSLSPMPLLEKLGYGGEGIEVILFGPAAVQRIEQLENSSDELADWIIAHKNDFLPSGIPEEEIVWDYQEWQAGEVRCLCLAVTKAKVIAEIEVFLSQWGQKTRQIEPFIALLLDCYDLETILAKTEELPIQVPGTKTELVATGGGFSLVTSLEETSKEFAWSFSAEDHLKQGLYLSDEICFIKPKDDIISRIHGFAQRQFKAIAMAMAVMLTVTVFLNIVITFAEKDQSERLGEFRFLQSNLDNLKSQINILQAQQNRFQALTSLKSHLLSYLDLAASSKPEEIWWRKLEYQTDKGLSIEGFSVGEAPAAVYYGTLANSKYIKDVQLSQISKYELPADSPIPPKFQGEVYKFKLLLEGPG